MDDIQKFGTDLAGWWGTLAKGKINHSGPNGIFLVLVGLYVWASRLVPADIPDEWGAVVKEITSRLCAEEGGVELGKRGRKESSESGTGEKKKRKKKNKDKGSHKRPNATDGAFFSEL